MIYFVLAFIGTASALDACTATQGNYIKMHNNMLATCAYQMQCTDQEADDNNNNRRRLQDEDQDLVAKYACYCSLCTDYMQDLMDACNACDVVNYCEVECDDDGDCACAEEEGGMSFFSTYCLIDERVVMPHADSFCNMMSGASEDCLTEMQYMLRPPEEENDDNNNGRRLLDNNNNNDDEEQWEMQPEQLLACWAAPFAGSDNNDNYYSLEYCSNLCDMYNQQSFDYMSKDVPVQTCGFSVSYLDDTEDSLSDLLPHPTRNQGVMCISSSCSSDDVTAISNYLVNMASYSQFINFEGEEGQNNNNNNNKNNDENAQVEVMFSVFETQGQWRCDGDGAEGVIENDNFPDECAQEEESKEDDTPTNETGGGHGLILALAIVFAMGFVLFFLLFLFYYRQAVALKTNALLADKGTSYGADKSQNAQVGV